MAGRRYTNDTDFFSQPSTLNSYWAGFIAADGCIIDSSSPHLSLHLHLKDRGHIEAFNRDTGSTNPLLYGKSNNVKCNYYCRQWVDDLSGHWNVVPRKSHTLLPPNITTPEHIRSFIVGYVDGDGCWDWHNTNTGSYLRLQVEGTKDILEWMSAILPGDGALIYRRPPRDRYYLRYVGRKALLVDEFLKEVAGLPRMSRKWYDRDYKKVGVEE